MRTMTAWLIICAADIGYRLVGVIPKREAGLVVAGAISALGLFLCVAQDIKEIIRRSK